MNSSNETINRKCGEIIITMKKNSKYIYSFNCWFCDTICIQMKKFTMHLEQEHENQLEQQPEGKAPTGEAITDVNYTQSHKSSTAPADIKVEECLTHEIVKSENEDDMKSECLSTRVSRQQEVVEFADPLETASDIEEKAALYSTKNVDIESANVISPRPTNKSFECENIERMHYTSEDFENDKDNSMCCADIQYGSSSNEDDAGDSADSEERPLNTLIIRSSKEREKELVIAILNAFKAHPQLWDTSQAEKCSGKQRDEMLQTLAENINRKYNTQMKLYTFKKKLSSLCTSYENEVEKEMSSNEKDAWKSDLWYYKHMEFLKSCTKNKLKLKKKKSDYKVKPLSDKLLCGVIEIYKKYSSLWDVNHLAYTVKEKRQESMQLLLEEINTKLALALDDCSLKKHIVQIHKEFAKEKQNRLECDTTQNMFKPTCSFYSKCDFLELNQGPFRCHTCHEIVETYNDYQLHKSAHDGSMPFSCRECGMGFKKVSNYTIHAKRHLGVFKFHCDICGKGYPFNAELDLHMRSHTGAQPYLCSICGEGFRTAISYDNHIRRHEERFKYTCHICKKGFNHMTRLNDHVKAHLNVRDIICAICGKGFTSRKYLNHHKRIHEGKNYNCNICGKSFAQDAGLRAHKKYHGTPIGVSSIQKEQNKYNLLS